MSNSASNRKFFDTTAVSITSDSSLVSSGIDYSVIGSRPSLLSDVAVACGAALPVFMMKTGSVCTAG